MNRFQLICRTALPLLLSVPCAARAQEAATPHPVPADVEAATPDLDPAEADAAASAAAGVATGPDGTPSQVAFSSDQLVYDERAELVTATGEVRMTREGHNLRADSVTWNRVTAVRAEGGPDLAPAATSLTGIRELGHVKRLSEHDDVLDDGGRLAACAPSGATASPPCHRRYTACEVLTPEGCPKEPTGRQCRPVVHDPVRHRISDQGAT